MQWRGRRQSSNIEDRRGSSGGFGGYGRSTGPRIGVPGGRVGRGGGIGIGAIVVILVIGWLTGINPLALLGGGGTGGGPVITSGSQPSGQTGTPDDEGGQFVAVVLADTESTWQRIFREGGKTYREPVLVLFSGSTSSPCGMASAATGPFYCPGDQKVYIDLAFYRELRTRFKAPGDFAQAYVVAHEIGHHVQNLLGILPKVNAARQQVSQVESNELSVRLELQADCLAGIWAHDAESRNVLDVGDIDEALNAAAQIGDDAIQRRTQGYVVPDSFNHGSSAQRSRWFKIGYQEGRLDACDTFGQANI
ncbi:MAG: neutral zinc metallopeptidase [Bauldia sp.]|uniref:KPN_02809 family neutral zinc metallopeptidase n=1 Tax=Bauldia sp. TaxID=2575872 RepID=UPI001E02BE57|nr:neutral zinc metallopeptidase [Bauldia sp.]MCB1494681.1 neutral zinc metallopeptidase [Bauldia sp.]